MKCSIKKFSEMYETVYRDLYRYALCLMKNPQEAEDAVSEAVIAAYENIHKLKKEEAFKSWIFTILTNNFRNKRQHRIMILQSMLRKHSLCCRKRNRY